MSLSISYPHTGASHRPTLRQNRATGGPARPFWCDVMETPWSKTMRNHIVSATLASGPGVPRMWRFYSMTCRDS
jgi:hypothetical protein